MIDNFKCWERPLCFSIAQSIIILSMSTSGWWDVRRWNHTILPCCYITVRLNAPCLQAMAGMSGRRHEKHASLERLEDFNSAGYCLMTACLRSCLGGGHTHSQILRLDIRGKRTLWVRLCSRDGDRAAVVSLAWGKFGVKAFHIGWKYWTYFDYWTVLELVLMDWNQRKSPKYQHFGKNQAV